MSENEQMLYWDRHRFSLWLRVSWSLEKSLVFLVISRLGAAIALFSPESLSFSQVYSKSIYIRRHPFELNYIHTFLSLLTGLLLLLGLVVYVSVFTAEIGSKLRPSSSLQPPMFTYTYGYSFLLVVTGFLAAEVTNTMLYDIYMYIYSFSFSLAILVGLYR